MPSVKEIEVAKDSNKLLELFSTRDQWEIKTTDKSNQTETYHHLEFCRANVVGVAAQPDLAAKQPCLDISGRLTVLPCEVCLEDEIF